VLPLTGATAEAMDAWITAGVTQGEAGECAWIWRTHDRGHEVLAAEGDACERTCGGPDGAGAWSKRVVVLRSPRHANHQATGWETRLRHAETQWSTRGGLCRMRCGAIATHTAGNASATASSAGSISHRCVSHSTSTLRASRTC
jgi:hypothetical protein